MGMYPLYHELPASNLLKLFLDPLNSDYVDKIVFGQENVIGSESNSSIPDSKYFKMNENEKEEYGVLDLGKGFDFFNYNPFLKFLKLSENNNEIIELEKYLESHEKFYELQLDPEPTITSRRTVIFGKNEYIGFASENVCYGISGYRLPIELKYIWNQIESIFDKYTTHIDQFMKLFREEIIYYYRIYIRGNGDLFMMT